MFVCTLLNLSFVQFQYIIQYYNILTLLQLQKAIGFGATDTKI